MDLIIFRNSSLFSRSPVTATRSVTISVFSTVWLWRVPRVKSKFCRRRLTPGTCSNTTHWIKHLPPICTRSQSWGCSEVELGSQYWLFALSHSRRKSQCSTESLAQGSVQTVYTIIVDWFRSSWGRIGRSFFSGLKPLLVFLNPV